MSPSPPAFSLMLPTLNGARTLPALLEALERQTLRPVRRIAVDSGSTDGTGEILREAGFQVHTIPPSEFDHGATRDLGISLAQGEIVVLLVQDALPTGPEFLEALTEPFSRDPRIAGVYGRQIPRPGGNPVLRARLERWAAGRTEPRLQEPLTEAELQALSPWERLERCSFDNVASAVRRSAWEVHPFGRRPFGEDLAWARRVLLGGWKIFFQPRAAVVHSHDRTPWAEMKRLYCDHQNLRELFSLVLLPTFPRALQAAEAQRRAYHRLLRELDLSPRERARWERWARWYAPAEALGTWLGARSQAWKEGRRPWFPLLDRWLRRGI